MLRFPVRISKSVRTAEWFPSQVIQLNRRLVYATLVRRSGTPQNRSQWQFLFEQNRRSLKEALLSAQEAVRLEHRADEQPKLLDKLEALRLELDAR